MDGIIGNNFLPSNDIDKRGPFRDEYRNSERRSDEAGSPYPNFHAIFFPLSGKYIVQQANIYGGSLVEPRLEPAVTLLQI
ncbi:hypothetical protein AVEN_271498-1 [Araneus ventricosus]|uniref:Uncharacterized protein n=1 Tax=Araneus ventricosus TaxID=182803 RepID=A0A4Y2ID74_ARAVE|nr:hypothetical protein AVEN_271498-1 [Araneus ventricosus]